MIATEYHQYIHSLTAFAFLLIWNSFVIKIKYSLFKNFLFKFNYLKKINYINKLIKFKINSWKIREKINIL